MKRKHIISMSILTMVFLSTVILLFNILTKTVFANNKSYDNKTFASVKIEEGDTLWNIATRYITKDYKNITTYIKEIKKTNQLSSDIIHTGGYIIVPYYYDSNNIS